MILNICKWYSIVLMILAICITISRDGKVTTEYSGKIKLIAVILHLPILYFLFNS